MKKLILVRHGESEWNKMNLFTGWTDVDLTPYGMCEAYMAGRLLKDEGYRPTMCYTSYLKRAVKTLNQILDAMDMDYLPVEKSWRLNEKSYGALQGANKAETLKKYGEEKLMQWRRSYDVQPPALEIDDKRNPRKDPRYAAVSDAELPATEALCDTIVKNGLSVRQLEERIKSLERKAPASHKDDSDPQELPEMYYRLLENIGRYVGENGISLRRGRDGRGSLTIRFESNAQAEAFLKALDHQR